MKMKFLLLVLVAIMATVLLAGCAPGVNPAVDTPDIDGKTAGFWSGLWNGIISPVTFIISLFTDNVNMYNVHNNGNWYDFGFILGVSIIFGGSAGGSARRNWKK